MNIETDNLPSHRTGLIWCAFAAVYVVWGSTYLAIRFAVETIPPFLMGGARFLLAGSMVYGWLRLRGIPAPTRAEWRTSAVIGALLLGFGNGCVCWAEQRISSSVTALLIAMTPVWFALLGWLQPGGTRPRVQTALGILTGFAGVVFLVRPAARGGSLAIDVPGFAALTAASVAWAAGSLYSRKQPHTRSPLMGVAAQMLSGGVILAAIGLLAGEGVRLHPGGISPRSAGGFFYLVFFGSLVGYTAYHWLLKASTPARVSTYAYINPVIAVVLGWALGGEKLTLHTLWAALVIVLGVLIITLQKSEVDPGFVTKLFRRPAGAPSPAKR